MESKGEINISPNYTKEDYFQLNLCMSSDEVVWQKAVKILKDRIYGRFLNQIESLSYDINSNGFAIMALNCLLIETLLQFRAGQNTTCKGQNEQCYADFLTQEFPSDFNTREKAKKFYTNIRCGILHSAQTKSKSRLSDREGFVVEIKEATLIVSVSGISGALRAYFDDYLKKLLDPGETELRENFIRKMEFVCRS